MKKISTQVYHASIAKPARVLLILLAMSGYSLSALAQTYNTAAGSVTWSMGSNNISEVTLTRGGTTHNDGLDGGLYVTVSGTNISYTNSYHFSSTYGAAIQHIAVTNTGASASTFTLTSSSNLGSDGNTRYYYTSTSTNRFTISSDNSGGSSVNGTDPVISLIYGNSVLNSYSTSMSFSNNSDAVSFTISNVPIAAGKTRRLLIVMGVGNITNSTANRPVDAYTAVQALLAGSWPEDFTSFLTHTQKAEVLNWTELAILPVTWGDFTAQPLENSVRLNWSTLQELNTKDFVVEHSTDGRNWSDIGSVMAAGQSNQETFYRFLHTTPVAGNNFYRIRQNDIDGRNAYSKNVKVVLAPMQEKWRVLQNPVTAGKLTVQLSEPVLMSLYNSEGKLLWEQQMAPGYQQVDMGTRSAGIYFLKGGGSTERLLVK